MNRKIFPNLNFLAKAISFFCAILSILLILGSVAILLHIWNPYPNPPSNFINDKVWGRIATIKFKDLYKREGEADNIYLERLTFLVSAHLVHFWPKDKINYVASHPLHNFPLWCQIFVKSWHKNDGEFGQEFWTPRNAWIRGYGLCSQASKIVFGVLQAQGFPARYLSNSEHVVVSVDNYIIDADYGVIIPYDIDEIAKHPEKIESYYSNFPDQLENLKKIYAKNFEKMHPAWVVELMHREVKSFVLHWIILLLLAFINLLILRRMLAKKIP